MTFKNDVLVRSLLACDHVASQPPTHNLFHSLWATSFLLTCADIFDRPHLKNIAASRLAQIEEITYQQNGRSLIVKDGKTKAVWNAICSHCYLKLGDEDKAFEYRKGASVFETHRDHNGVLVVAFAADPTRKKDAERAAEIVMASERLSAFDAWGLAFWGKQDKHAEYIYRMIKTVPASTQHMVGIVGPTLIQICLAYKYLTGSTEFDVKVEEVLDFQQTLQVLYGKDCGSYVRSPKEPITRLDYTLYNAFALLQKTMPIEPRILF